MERHPLHTFTAIVHKRPEDEGTTPPALALQRGLEFPPPAHPHPPHRLPRRSRGAKRVQRGHVLHHALRIERDTGGHQHQLRQRHGVARLAHGSARYGSQTDRGKGHFHVEQASPHGQCVAARPCPDNGVSQAIAASRLRDRRGFPARRRHGAGLPQGMGGRGRGRLPGLLERKRGHRQQQRVPVGKGIADFRRKLSGTLGNSLTL